MSFAELNRHAPCQIPPNYQPNVRPSEIAAKYPDIGNPEAVLEEFILHHLARGKTSRSWDADFLGFCAYRQRQAKQQAAQSRDTDSMGYSSTPGRARLTGSEGDYGRRFLAAYRKHIEAGLSPGEAKIEAERELE